jgi:1,4-alpha-glucan branching enzyme
MKNKATSEFDVSVQALADARYNNHFAWLGQHLTEQGLSFRVWAPGAKQVDVLCAQTGRKITRLTLNHPSGFFEKTLGNRRRPIGYRLSFDGGEPVADAYAYGNLLDATAQYFYAEGQQTDAYRWLGAQHCEFDDVSGVRFTVWAPNAQRVAVVGDFNGWDASKHGLKHYADAGIWVIFIPNAQVGQAYKFHVLGADGLVREKADPYARQMERSPATASLVPVDTDFQWADDRWMAGRGVQHTPGSPISIYECQLASWMRDVDNHYLTYRELAERLIAHVKPLGFTHIQLMPVSEYPFDGSWGYQPVGLYAPTSRFGSLDDFKDFVNRCHQAGLGVLLDWVPGHFPSDLHGLAEFDGTALYEHADPRRGFHPDWNTYIYNYGRNEVRSFLLSNADFWLSECHIDGLRVDAVASMLYLDYSRAEGEWIPNEHGGRENLEAVTFLQALNSLMYAKHPGIMMIAEESTAWPGVSHPVDQGGLGFGYKWNMGWMNDTLRYMSKDPIHRSYHHDDMTFSMVYARDENFILSISHDECVHGKGSLLNKMPGDDWQQRANLRAYWAYMWAHPGKKLLFMGMEFGQYREWNHDHGLDWYLLDQAEHRQLMDYIARLNQLYTEKPALYAADQDAEGFCWLQAHNKEQSILAWVRSAPNAQKVIVVCNYTPTVIHDYRVGVPNMGRPQVLLNSDAASFGGSDVDPSPRLDPVPWDGCEQSVSLTLPPLATVWLVVT